MKKTVFIFIILILPMSFCLADDTNSIGAIAKAKGIDFGFAVNYDSLKNDKEYQSIIKKQATIIVPMNELKWSNVHPKKEVYDFKKSDYIINFAINNNLKIRGHTLVWHNRIPDYVQNEKNKQQVEKIFYNHIYTVVSRYKNKISSWDVVNEVINPADNQPNGLRNSYWYKMFGEQYIDIAFQQAHKADPKAVLLYNEWGVEYDTKWSETKREYVISLIKRLKSKNIPIDGFGIQSHISTQNINFVNSKLIKFINDLNNLGLKVYITELDVTKSENEIEKSSNFTIENTYKKYLDIVLLGKKINTIIIWGVYNHEDNNNLNLNHFPQVLFNKKNINSKNFNAVEESIAD